MPARRLPSSATRLAPLPQPPWPGRWPSRPQRPPRSPRPSPRQRGPRQPRPPPRRAPAPHACARAPPSAPPLPPGGHAARLAAQNKDRRRARDSPKRKAKRKHDSELRPIHKSSAERSASRATTAAPVAMSGRFAAAAHGARLRPRIQKRLIVTAKDATLQSVCLTQNLCTIDAHALSHSFTASFIEHCQ